MANPSAIEDKHLLIERTLPAPRSLVYQAFTDPKRIAQWMGPHGFVATTIEGDVREGGAWRSGMRAPDGTEHIASGVYREVVPNERLVFTYAWEEGGARGHETVCRVELSDAGAQTRLVFSQGPFETRSSAEGHNGGWSQAFEKLATAVAA
jgi:uncharacterized protein YndB with AHSA1/START domain